MKYTNIVLYLTKVKNQGFIFKIFLRANSSRSNDEPHKRKSAHNRQVKLNALVPFHYSRQKSCLTDKHGIYALSLAITRIKGYLQPVLLKHHQPIKPEVLSYVDQISSRSAFPPFLLLKIRLCCI